MPTISPRPSRRALVAIAIAAMSLASSCAALVPQDLQVPKVYIKDYTPRLRGEQISGEPAMAELERGLSALRRFGTIGMIFSPKFIYSIDPVLLLHVTEPRQVAPDAMVTEPYYDSDGEPKTRQVMRKPMFMLDNLTISYQIPGYEIPPVTLEQNVPIKSNDHILEPMPVSQVKPLIEAFTQGSRPGAPISGTFTMTLDMRDLDPSASERSFKVSRTFPLLYTYQILVSETISNAPPDLGASPTPEPTSTPAASPAPESSATPTPVPLASPVL